jgi:hypothetical protein
MRTTGKSRALLLVVLLNIAAILLGRSLARAATVHADFNGDGRADLAIGVPGESIEGNTNNSGAVNVLYGSAVGLSTTGNQLWDFDSVGVPGVARADQRFGTALATGDFNGDGRSDLAIGAPFADVNGHPQAGTVVVLYGSANGLTATGAQRWDQDSTDILDSAEDFDLFGLALAAGDFDGDGRDDLAIGVPGEDIESPNLITRAGAVHVLYGSATGLKAARNQLWTQDSPGVLDTAEDLDLFGAVLVAGDFNGDRRADLAIGVPLEDVGSVQDAGAVNVLYGARNSGLKSTNNQFWTQNSSGVLDSVEAFDRFGSALAAGDFNGDGRADLAIGVEDEDVNGAKDAGAVNVLYGSRQRLTATGNQLWTQDSPGIADVAENDDAFGDSLTAGDFDGDGRDDLAIGVPLQDIPTNDAGAAGRVNVIYGSSGGLASAGNTLWSQNTAGVAETAEAFDLFGISVAADDFNGDGRADLAIGVLESFGTVGSVGAVHVLYGDATGVSATGSQLWNQDTPGVSGAAEQGDAFGRALGNCSRADPFGGGLSGAWVRVAEHCAGADHQSDCKLSGAIEVTNPGITAVDATVLRFFLSADQTLDDGDLLLASVAVQGLRPGKSHREKLDVTAAESHTGGFVIAVLDATNAVQELNEANNVVVSPSIP